LYGKARDILGQLLQEHPGTRAFADALTVTLHDLAALHTREGRPREALAVLDKARAVRAALVRDSPEALTMRRYEAEHELHRGRVNLAMKQRAAAQANFRKSCDLLDGLGNAPGQERMRAYTYLGVVQAAGLLQRGDALASLHTALDLLKKAGEPAALLDEPGEQAETCFLLGAGLMNLGRPAESILPFQRAVEHGRAALARASHSRALRKALSRSYFHLGQMQRDVGRPAEAATTCRQRQKLWPDDANELFDAARELCLCAEGIAKGKKGPDADEQAQRRRYLDEAMDVLRQALARGLKGAREVRQDSDLKLLRDRADFKELLAEMGRREGSAPK
jgi:tetratricopeptide (TPR) repeat protein